MLLYKDKDFCMYQRMHGNVTSTVRKKILRSGYGNKSFRELMILILYTVQEQLWQRNGRNDNRKDPKMTNPGPSLQLSCITRGPWIPGERI